MKFLLKLFSPKFIIVLIFIGGTAFFGIKYAGKYFLTSDNSVTPQVEQEVRSQETNTNNPANIGDNYQSYDKPFVPAEGFADLVEFVNPAIVNISAVKVVKTQNMDIALDTVDPSFREFFKNIMPEESKEQKYVSLGSGFVVRSDGFVVTNNHVIKGAEKVQVNFSDGKKLEAKVYAVDEVTDIALLKINATDLKTLKFGDSDKVRVGDWVIAVGNPFGLGGTVSSGIVSAIGRDIQIGPYNDFIQTDAAINKGNSGGPMINTKGEVVGINTAIFSTQGGGSIGIGFAVPSNIIKNIISQLITDKKVIRGWLGVQIQSIDENMSKTLGLQDTVGALVAKVVPNGPASKAGIKGGDVIVAVNGETLKTSKGLPKIISGIHPKTEITLTVISNKVKKDVKVFIEEIPDNINKDLQDIQDNQGDKKTKVKEATFDDIGVKTVEINDTVRKLFKMDTGTKGVVVIGVKKSSIAQQKGLSAGLRIVSINQEDITNIEQLTASINKNKSSGLLILVEDMKQNRIFISISKKEIETGVLDTP